MTLSEALIDKSWRHLIEFIKFSVFPTFGDLEAGEDDQERALELADSAFRALVELLKEAIDIADDGTFAEVDQQWQLAVQSQLDLVRYSASHDTRADDIGRELATNLDVYRLGLATWTVHRLRQGPRGDRRDRLVAILKELAGRLGDFNRLLAVFEAAEEHDNEKPWSWWRLRELPEGQVHVSDPEGDLLFGMVILFLIAADGSVESLIPEPHAWTESRRDKVHEILDSIAQQPELWLPLLPPETQATPGDGIAAPVDPRPDLERRIARVREAFDRAVSAATEHRSDRVRSADPDPARVQSFRRVLLEGFREQRLVRDLFDLHGARLAEDAPPAGHEGKVLTQWMPREYFVGDSRVAGVDLIAGDLARISARAEVGLLLAACKGPIRSQQEEMSAAFESTVGEMRADELNPSLALVPINWRLEDAIGLDPGRRMEGAPAVPGIPLAHRSRFDGVIDGVPMLGHPEVPQDRFWVIDLAAAAQFIEWPSDCGSGLAFELRFFDAEGAEALLSEHPEVRGDESDDQAAIDNIRDRALLTLRLCFSIEPRREDAARAIAVPAELQRE